MVRWTSGFWVRAAIACVEQTRADQELVRTAIGATMAAELRLRWRPLRARLPMGEEVG
jgi:hypothetical protein